MTVVDWPLDSDPAIRWQVKRDLTDAPGDEVEAERRSRWTRARADRAGGNTLPALRVLRWYGFVGDLSGPP